jgi:beta-lactam-binding protein with PASTA domain
LNAPPPVLVARRTERPDIQPARNQRDASIVHVGAAAGARDLPDFRGLSAREALRVLTKIGLTARLTGNGAVTSQVPAPGTPIEPGMAFELKLERTPLADASLAVGP